MKKLWRQFAALVTALKNSFSVDIFTEARFKIAFLFFVMGIIILGVAGYLAYTRSIMIIQDVIQFISHLLAVRQNMDPVTTTNLITQTVGNDISQMDLMIGFWIVLTLVISAYILAGVALYPIRKAMDKQRRFIANVAHELRTPLSVMRTETEVALLTAMTATHKALLDTIQSNFEEIDRMSKITQFLLEFSDLESRLATLQFVRVDLTAVVQKTVHFMKKFARENDVQLVMLPLANVTVLRGNATALEEMVTNLLKNALHYTPSGGIVVVGLSRTVYRGALLTVRDTGIGIPEDDIPLLFEPFHRGKNVKAAKMNGGTGLGLAIVKEIVTLHKATIHVKSSVGAGTTISVRFSPFAVR